MRPTTRYLCSMLAHAKGPPTLPHTPTLISIRTEALGVEWCEARALNWHMWIDSNRRVHYRRSSGTFTLTRGLCALEPRQQQKQVETQQRAKIDARTSWAMLLVSRNSSPLDWWMNSTSKRVRVFVSNRTSFLQIAIAHVSRHESADTAYA